MKDKLLGFSVLNFLVDLLRSPFLNFLLLLGGIFVCAVIAPKQNQVMEILRGGEIVVLALMRFVIWNQMRWFYTCLIFVGIMMPVVASCTAPIFYHSRNIPLLSILGMAAVVIIPAIPLIFLGWRGLINLNYKNVQTINEKGLWKYIFEGAVWLTVSSFSTGEWNEYTVTAIIISSLADSAMINSSFFAEINTHLIMFTRVNCSVLGPLID